MQPSIRALISIQSAKDAIKRIKKAATHLYRHYVIRRTRVYRAYSQQRRRTRKPIQQRYRAVHTYTAGRLLMLKRYHEREYFIHPKISRIQLSLSPYVFCRAARKTPQRFSPSRAHVCIRTYIHAFPEGISQRRNVRGKYYDASGIVQPARCISRASIYVYI